MYASCSWSFGCMLDTWGPKHVHVAELEHTVCGQGLGASASKMEVVWTLDSDIKLKPQHTEHGHPWDFFTSKVRSVPVYRHCVLQVKNTQQIVLSSCTTFHYLLLSVPHQQKTKQLWRACNYRFWSLLKWRSGKRNSFLKCPHQQHLSMFCQLYSTPEGTSSKSSILKASSISPLCLCTQTELWI